MPLSNEYVRAARRTKSCSVSLYVTVNDRVMPREISSSEVTSIVSVRVSRGVRPAATKRYVAGTVVHCGTVVAIDTGIVPMRTAGFDATTREIRRFVRLPAPMFFTEKLTRPVSQLSRNSSLSPPSIAWAIDDVSMRRFAPAAVDPAHASQFVVAVAVNVLTDAGPGPFL